MAAWLNRETQLCAAILPDRIIGDWSLPLLARQVVKLGIVDSISREIVGRRLRFSAPVVSNSQMSLKGGFKRKWE